MAEYKLNKVELTRFRRQVKTYNQFLPVLKLKQEQLQSEQLKARRMLVQLRLQLAKKRVDLETLIAMLDEPLAVDIAAFLRPVKIETGSTTVAGVEVPHVEKIHFPALAISFFGNPLWLTRSADKIRDLIRLNIETSVSEERLRRITMELRKTTQRVNLFEQVLIPDAKEAIRRIRIALGDQQVAAVGRAKVAKRKTIEASLRRAS
jgi:V/A-type H+/Na+-transporting ATPase subunit D